MVCKDDKPPALEHVAEMAYSGETGPELSIKGEISLLGCLQLLRKKT
jgi:hypothetical protein